MWSGRNEALLSNEFAEVRVEWSAADRRLFQITDLGSGAAALLDPCEAIRVWERDRISINMNRSAEVDVDYAANGPRLKISDVETGLTIYLDPLQLADAAVAGAWGKLPPAYDAQ